MIKYIGLAVVSALLIHSAGAWAYVFFVILERGEVTFNEPNRPWLLAEFWMAIAWTLVGILFLGVAIWGLKKRGKRIQ